MSLLTSFIKPRNWKDITLALAATIQACEQIHLLAHGKTVDQQVLTVAIQSLFVFDPKDVIQTYAGVANLKPGLAWLAKVTTSRVQAKDRDILQYLTSILYLTRMMLNDKPRLKRLHDRLQTAKNQVDYFHELHPQVLAGIADIYSQSISSLSFRIQIRGLRQVLTQELSMQTVRCLLLAGFRAAVLWQQVGGRRWQLLFSRKRIADTAKQLLADIDA
jgi:high frequency lysogenization protein